MDAPEIGVRIEDRAPVVARDGDALPVGVSGALTNGDMYALLRDGDTRDGALTAGVHDASQYPYHLVLITRPDGWSDVQCSGAPDRCKDYFGLSGGWSIESTAPFLGTFDVGTLTAQENCWEDGLPLDTSGCALLPGRMTGCFNVD